MIDGPDRVFDDRTPGVEEYEPTASYLSYTAGLVLAILLTIVSFVVAQTNLLWPPGIPVGLIVLAFAQIGVHLVFFLHLGSGPDNTNNILALAFGVLIVFLVIAGSIWIIANLNWNMLPMH
ncbi:MAG: cytochrome o ubiquinol oxidase subunit IV [Alphaproteobacteria bacterium]|nr:cytochrome o ubiquinol oxidase subunit IV [Alphaproteobacteria bacterium]